MGESESIFPRKVSKIVLPRNGISGIVSSCLVIINQQIVLRYKKFAKLSSSDALRMASFQPKVTTARRQFFLLQEIICCPLLEFSYPMILTMNKKFSGLEFLQASSVVLRTVFWLCLSAKYESSLP